MGPCAHKVDFTGNSWRETRAPVTDALVRPRYTFEQMLTARVKRMPYLLVYFTVPCRPAARYP